MEKQEVMNNGATLILRARMIESFYSNVVFLMIPGGAVMLLGVIFGSLQRDVSLVYLGFGIFAFTVLFGFFSQLFGGYCVKRMRKRAVNLYDSVGIKVSGQ